jgi:nucleoid-associated protein YgaU
VLAGPTRGFFGSTDAAPKRSPTPRPTRTPGANPTEAPHAIAATATEAPTPAPAPAPTEARTPTTYTVQSGDSLSSIAARVYYDSTEWHAIYDANRDAIGADPGGIHAGTELPVPPKQAR